MKINQTLLSYGKLSLNIMITSEGNPFKNILGNNPRMEISSYIGFSVRNKEASYDKNTESFYISYFEMTNMKSILEDALLFCYNDENYYNRIINEEEVLSIRNPKSFKMLNRKKDKAIMIKPVIIRKDDVYERAIKMTINNKEFSCALDLETYESFVKVFLETNLHLFSHLLYNSYLSNLIINNQNFNLEEE